MAEAEGVKPLSHAQQKLIQSQQVQKERSFNTEVFIKELLMKITKGTQGVGRPGVRLIQMVLVKAMSSRIEVLEQGDAQK